MKFNISIIIPVFAGKYYLHELIKKIIAVRDSWLTNDFPIEIGEVIFVDDASLDDSKAVIEQYSSLDWVRLVQLSKNYGQHAATAAGILHSSGDWVVTMDEDLQHDPIHLISMLELAVMNEVDLVYVKSTVGVHQSWYRDLSSIYFKKLISCITKNPVITNFSSFRLMRGSTARSAAAVLGHDGYFDIVLSWFTNRVATHRVSMVDQKYINQGTSSYNLLKLLSHARRMIMTSDAKILRMIAVMGLILITGCIFFGSYIFLNRIFSPESITVSGWTSLILTILAIGSGLAISLSVIAEYLAIVVQHLHGKPSFSIVDRSRDRILRDLLAQKKN